MVYFININEQKNYSYAELRKWEATVTKIYSEFFPSNPHHIHKSYQLFQKVMIGIPHFVYPPKYACFVFCGASSLKDFNYKKQFIQEIYQDIVYEKCGWEKTKTLFIQHQQFNDGSSPSNQLHGTLMDLIQKSISENAPQIILNPTVKSNDDIKKDDTIKNDDEQNLIASIYGTEIAEIRDKEYVQFILFCSVLDGFIKVNDKLLLLPANIEVEILDMRGSGNKHIKYASKNVKISVKIKVDYDEWRVKSGMKILHKLKRLLISKDCIFHWESIEPQDIRSIHSLNPPFGWEGTGFEAKLYLSSRYNFQKGIFINQELLISYLGQTYAVSVIDFPNCKPSIDTIPEWNALYNVVSKTYQIQLSDIYIRCIMEYVLIADAWNGRVGLSQHKSLTVTLRAIRDISFCTMKPFNKFCVLAQNEIVAKGKWIGVKKTKIHYFPTIFDLTDSEISFLFRQLPGSPKFSKFELIHRGSVNGFDVNSFVENCANKGPTLCIIKTKETGEIFGGYHNKDIPELDDTDRYKAHDHKAFVFVLRGKNNVREPKYMRFRDESYPNMTTNIGIRFGGNHGLYLVDGCDENQSHFMRNAANTAWHSQPFYLWNLRWYQQNVSETFLTEDYEVWRQVT